MIELVLDRHSPLPAYAQIQEQIKLALLLGTLRPGDTLPSIRDVETEMGVSRNIVRKAYLELQRSGILSLKHGKGVVVDKQLTYSQRGSIKDSCERLSQEIFNRLLHVGVSPPAFARYLYQQARETETRAPFMVFVDATRTLAEERAAKISSIWQVPLPGLSLEELATMQPARLKSIRKVLTNYLRRDQVLDIVAPLHIEVIPVGLTFEVETVREFARFPPGSSLVLVLDNRDYPSLSLILELYRKILLDPSVRISSMPLSKIKDIPAFVRTSKFHRIIFSNRLWDKLPDRLRKHPKVTHPHMTVDLASLESVRIRAGVII